ncbi:YoaK family protein [Dactylosporangium sp. NPDC051485]|uniref:YoaK family protein n=1 Tax=Dactylosporangium sp. NPDC051485 TaxID=3154846 RepID=UPI00342EA7FF
MRRTSWILALALAAGYIDGLALLHLGGIFASVVTGNLVLIGVAAATDPHHLADPAIRAALATTVYTTTIWAARRLPPGRCLVAATATLCTLAGSWAITHHDPQGLVQLPLLTLATIAVALQAAAQPDTDQPTTYLTGTLTRLAQGRARLTTDAPALIAIPTGAATAALLLNHAPWLGPLPAVALLATASVIHTPPPRPPRTPTPAPQRQAAYTP